MPPVVPVPVPADRLLQEEEEEEDKEVELVDGYERADSFSNADDSLVDRSVERRRSEEP